MAAGSVGQRVSRRVRSVRWWGFVVMLAGFLLSIPAVTAPDEGTYRLGSLELMLRVLFVPIGEVTNTPLLWASRAVVLVGIVMMVVGAKILHEPDV